jgi:hypothetical protein
VLDWEARERPGHAERLTFVSTLLRIRREHIMPLLPKMTLPGAVRLEHGVLAARWPAGDRHLILCANLSDAPAPKPAILAGAQTIWDESPPDQLLPWSVMAAVGHS